MCEVQERLKRFIAEQGISMIQFEKECGLSNGAGAKISSNVRKSTLDRISNGFPSLNIEWLMTGKEPMLRDMTIHQSGHHNVLGACNHIEEACDRALQTLCEQQRLRIEALEGQLKNERITNERLWAMLEKLTK